MKYFILIDSPYQKYCPKIESWFKKIDVRDIRIDRYSMLPKQEFFFITSTTNIIFTDIILFPFLLVSPKVKEIIEMYGDPCFFRQIVLLDQINKKSRLYYLPVLDETDKLKHIVIRKNTIINDEIEENPVFINKNIFWIKDSIKRYTVLSLDFAESLLRRNLTGIGLQEVLLYNIDEK